jgi:hypothetical protein
MGTVSGDYTSVVTEGFIKNPSVTTEGNVGL